MRLAKVLVVLVGFLSVALSNCVFASEEEVRITNGTFEGEVSEENLPGEGWQCEEGAVGIEVDEKVFHGGKRSLRISRTEHDKRGITNMGSRPLLKPGTRYRIEGYMKTDNVVGRGAAIFVQQFRSADKHFGWLANVTATKSMQGTNDWTKVDCEFTTPEGSDFYLNVKLFVHKATGSAWFDDIALYELGNPGESTWRSQRRLVKVETLQKSEGDMTYNDKEKAIKVSGTSYWVTAEKDLGEPLLITEESPVFLVFRLYAEGSTSSCAVGIVTTEGKKYNMSWIPVEKDRWQTLVVKVNDMRVNSWKDRPLHPTGLRLRQVALSQRCALGDERGGEGGETISPEHSFIIGDMEILKGNDGEKKAERIVSEILGSPYYCGDLNYIVKKTRNVRIWHAPSAVHVFRDHPIPKGRARHISLSASKGEWESFQLVLNSTPGGKAARVEPGVLRHKGGKYEISKTNIEVYPVSYIYIRLGKYNLSVNRWYPDALSRNEEVDLVRGENQPFWVTFHVPKAAPAGIYEGTINVKVGDDKHRVPVRLKVWDFSLPEVFHFQTNLQIWGPENPFINRPQKELRWELYKLLGRYHLYDGNSWFGLGQERRKMMVEKYGQNTVKLTAAFGHGTRTMKFRDAEIYTEEYEKEVKKFLKRKIGILKENGWEDKGFCYIWDEPMGSFEVVKKMKYITGLIKEVSPEVRTLAASGAFPELHGVIDIFLAGYNTGYLEKVGYVDKSLPYSFWRGAANPLIGDDLLSIRLWGIENWKYNLTGYYSWGISVWSHKRLPEGWNPWEDIGEYLPAGTLNGCGLIVYPGGVPQSKSEKTALSMRLEMIRDAVEDYECLYLLESLKKGKSKAVAAQIDDVIKDSYKLCKVFQKEYEKDPGRYYTVREKIAEAIVKFR